MPITVSQMAVNERSLAIDIDGETLNVVYRPSKLTLKNMTIYDSKFEGMVQVLSELIKSWDLTVSPEDTSMYPLDQESLAALDIRFLRQVGWGIMGDSNPN